MARLYVSRSILLAPPFKQTVKVDCLLRLWLVELGDCGSATCFTPPSSMWFPSSLRLATAKWTLRISKWSSRWNRVAATASPQICQKVVGLEKLHLFASSSTCWLCQKTQASASEFAIFTEQCEVTFATRMTSTAQWLETSLARHKLVQLADCQGATECMATGESLKFTVNPFPHNRIPMFIDQIYTPLHQPVPSDVSEFVDPFTHTVHTSRWVWRMEKQGFREIINVSNEQRAPGCLIIQGGILPSYMMLYGDW